MSSLTDQTTAYAQDVVSGKIIAGKYVRLAAQRHLDDLKAGPDRGLRWDVEKAERAIRFFPAVLSITEGELEGEPFKLLPWHVFVVGSIFGWLLASGRRRFRFIWLETGKGQAKSPLMAAIGIYLMAFEGLKRPEIYCIGEKKDTAKVVFRDAVAMAKAPIPENGGDTLENTGRIVIRGKHDNAYKIEHPASNGYMLPIANTDSVDGPKPIGVMCDEVHVMRTDKALTTWAAAITKKAGSPMMIMGTNTPAIDQVVGTARSEIFQRVLRGEFEDDSRFAYIARIDEGDKPFEDESCWIKSLPALGITYPVENVRATVKGAMGSPANKIMVKRLYFGIPVGSSGHWIDEDRWRNALGPVDETEMNGRRCHFSLDLSTKNDLTALTATWEGEHLVSKTWYFTREYELAKRKTEDQIPYDALGETGEITITPGMVIDFEFVAQKLKDLCAGQSEVVQMVVDSAYVKDFVQACDNIGFDVWVMLKEDQKPGDGLKIVRHAQGKRVVFDDKMLCMPVSIRHLEDKILKGDITIDDNRLTTICSSNAVLEGDAQMNKMFEKKKSRGRIDGIVTIAMGVGSATSEMKTRSSVYEKRGIRELSAL